MEKTLLIVEDDENISKALEVRLSARGFNVVTAFDAIMGMQKAVQLIPDAIVLDITMPGGNGLALAKRLKESAITRDIPFIFLTASKQDGLRQQAVSLGGAAFFEKPYDFEYLLAAIRAVLEHPHARLSL
ncbi:MAG: response regulator [Nitrospira sp.]|nr:response regulator [Nitrospira sp.]HBP88639.1 two-component system response regulator [Nitrospiraceae bacterium]HNP29251.1 response regulator [Nitrospirales bacterium]